MKAINCSKIFCIRTYVLVLCVFVVGVLCYCNYGLPFQNNPNNLIPNKYLEMAVREAIGKPNGEITLADCVGVRELDLSSADYNTDLEGIQFFQDLERLTSNAGNLKDLTALEGLEKLKYLYLYFNNIEDLTPLASLSSLEELDISKNHVQDISPLVKLENLKVLVIYKNDIKNLDLLSEKRDLQIFGN